MIGLGWIAQCQWEGVGKGDMLACFLRSVDTPGCSGLRYYYVVIVVLQMNLYYSRLMKSNGISIMFFTSTI